MWPSTIKIMGCILGTCDLLRGHGGLKNGRGGPQYLHFVRQTVRISVLKFAEKGVFLDRKFAKSEERVLILLHNDIIFGQLIEAHLKILFLSLQKGFDRLLNRKKTISTSNCLSRKRNTDLYGKYQHFENKVVNFRLNKSVFSLKIGVFLSLKIHEKGSFFSLENAHMSSHTWGGGEPTKRGRG